MNKDNGQNDKPEEDKALPLNLRNILRKPPETESGIQDDRIIDGGRTQAEERKEKLEDPVSLKIGRSKKSRAPKEETASKPVLAGGGGAQKSVELEQKRQLNAPVSRRHYRDSQRLLTDIKLFADERLNKSFTGANLMEFLIELGRDLYAAEPELMEEKILEFLSK